MGLGEGKGVERDVHLAQTVVSILSPAPTRRPMCNEGGIDFVGSAAVRAESQAVLLRQECSTLNDRRPAVEARSLVRYASCWLSCMFSSFHTWHMICACEKLSRKMYVTFVCQPGT